MYLCPFFCLCSVPLVDLLDSTELPETCVDDAIGRQVVGLATGDSEEAVSCPHPGTKETAGEKVDTDRKQTYRFFHIIMTCGVKVNWLGCSEVVSLQKSRSVLESSFRLYA